MQHFLKKLSVTAILSTTLLTNAFGFGTASRAFTATSLVDKSEDPIAITMDNLENMYRFAERNYLYDIDTDKVYEAMAGAMLDAFGDEWTMFIPSEESTSYRDHRTGNYGGIGIYMTKLSPNKQVEGDPSTMYITITSCFSGGPAERAGLRSKDMITHINGESVINKNASECAELLKGETGSILSLTILRGSKTFDIDIEREIVNVPTAQSTVLDDHIGYIKISEFSSITATQVKEKLAPLSRMRDLKALIIDLRNNGGGDVKASVDIADYLIPGHKVIVSAVGKNSSRNETQMTNEKSEKFNTDCPIIVLINSGTASASEILSGALQDNKRAIIMGEKSFGKGVMQVSAPFGNGYVNVTSQEYKTPNGNKVNKVGITPDVVVKNRTVENENVDELNRIANNKVAEKYVDLHKDFTDKNIENFVKANKFEYAISDYLLSIIVLNEYLSRMDSTDRPVAFPKYDNVLSEAIAYIQKNY